MAAHKHVTRSSANIREENGSLISPSLLETRNLQGNKSKFCWSGTLEKLIAFPARHLNIKCKMAKLKETKVKKTTKVEHLILSPGNLRTTRFTCSCLQSYTICYQNWTQKPWFPLNCLITFYSKPMLHHVMTSERNNFLLYVCKRTRTLLWTEINSLHNRFAEINQPNKGDVIIMHHYNGH